MSSFGGKSTDLGLGVGLQACDMAECCLKTESDGIYHERLYIVRKATRLTL